MTDAFENLKVLLVKYGYGNVVNTLNKDQIVDMLKEDVLEGLDITKQFEQNEKIIYDKFYDKNWISIYTIFSKDDVESLYLAVQQLLKT